ncbi:MAG: GIY-YIG nuclease family protein [Candidatus Altiarchaeales archaeon]|nr:MAG: GIY-YIG nuclease family protein [Candidatus Altiarchaeales archaeon]
MKIRRGSYILLMKLDSDMAIEIGALGRINFKKGFYAYVGSALNGLEQRLRRHLSKEKKKFWHIDYFLEKAEVMAIFIIESDRKLECKIAKELGKYFSVIKNFGSSDCSCEGHLFYVGKSF